MTLQRFGEQFERFLVSVSPPTRLVLRYSWRKRMWTIAGQPMRKLECYADGDGVRRYAYDLLVGQRMVFV